MLAFKLTMCYDIRALMIARVTMPFELMRKR